MKRVAEPDGSEGEDNDRGTYGRSHTGGKAAQSTRGELFRESGHCGGDRVREEIATSRSEQLGYASETVRSEDGKTHRTFSEVQHHRREACNGAKHQTNEQNGEVLQRQWYGGEGERKRDVCTQGDKG